MAAPLVAVVVMHHEHGTYYRKLPNKCLYYLCLLCMLIWKRKLAQSATSLLTAPIVSIASSKLAWRLRLYAYQ